MADQELAEQRAEAENEALVELDAWQPLATPKDPLYAEILSEIRGLVDRGKPRKAEAYFRVICEADFPFFMLHAHSFGRYICSEAGHDHWGKPWMTYPWVWERALELHHDFTENVNGKLYIWPRFHFKTALITNGGTCWDTLKDPLCTTAIITWKFEDTGTSIFGSVRTELERNEVLLRHWPHVLTPETAAKYTKRQITVARPPGPKEPSVSVHGMDSIPDSQHYRRVKVDDAVVRKTVQTPESIQKTFEGMQDLPALCDQNPYLIFIGTRWHYNDPYKLGMDQGQGKKKSMFAETSVLSCFDTQGKPILHTEEFLEGHRRAMGPYRFSAHFLSNPKPDSDQRLERSWLIHYESPPSEMRKYLILDNAEGSKYSDLMAATLVGLAGDRVAYALDMWREKFGLIDTARLVFSVVRRHKCSVVVDSYRGTQPLVETLKEKMGDPEPPWGVRFRLIKLPGVNEPKEQRISFLVPFLESGRLAVPEAGFGHGSKHNSDDTLDQFIKSEYELWSPEGSVGEDHTLDSLAWLAHPETRKRFAFPEFLNEEQRPSYVGHKKIKDRTQNRGGVPVGVSAWVF